MSAPIRAQYLHLKQPFPGALLLFRLGDFYELYDEDARVAARELGVPLTAREFIGGEGIPMCPLPYHAVEGPIKRLVARGYKGAIAEQIGDPRTACRLVVRVVVRVVTPTATIKGLSRSPLHQVIAETAQAPCNERGPSMSAGCGEAHIPNPAHTLSCGSDATQTTPPTDGGRAIQLTLFPHG